MPTLTLEGVLALLKSRWLHYAVLAAAVLFYRADARSWHHAFDAQKSATIAASAAATAKAIRAQIQHQAATAVIAERADNATDEADRLRRAAGAYRLRPEAHCSASRAGEATPARTPADRDRPGATPDDYVLIPNRDYDTLVDNTARLWQLRNEWAVPLIESGAAIPEVDFAKQVSQEPADH